MIRDTLDQLINQGEHQQLDFKFEISDSKKIARTLSAFSNTDGGRLLIGVKDNGRIAGVRSQEEYYMIEAAAQMYCKPEIRFKSKNWTVSGKTVLEIQIPADENNRPVLAPDEKNNWRAFVRVHDQNFIAPSTLRKFWKLLNHPKPVYLTYTPKEQKLVEYIDKNGSISLKTYSKIAHLPAFIAEKIIIDLLLLRVLDYQVTEHGMMFFFSEEFNIQNYQEK